MKKKLKKEVVLKYYTKDRDTGKWYERIVSTFYPQRLSEVLNEYVQDEFAYDLKMEIRDDK